MASTVPPPRPDDARTAEELIIELSECPLASETVPSAMNEIIMMCRNYVIEWRLFARQPYTTRRH